MTTSLETTKKLREATGLSFQQISKALQEADGDEAKAMENLKSLGVAMAAKKATREVKEGVVSTYVHSNKKLGTMVELLCETDFVARNDEFQTLSRDLAMHMAASKPATMAEFLEQPFVKNPDINIKELINQYIAKLGENIQIGEFVIFEI